MSAVSTVLIAPTMAVLIKEAMANMPDSLNTKKEIEEYFKIAMKEIVMKKKEEEKANKPEKPKKRVAKKPKKEDEDTDINGEEKPEKPKKRVTKKPKKEDEDTDSNGEEKVEKPKKSKKEKELDEDGNEVKKPPTEYIIFKKEMGIKIKEQFPDLNYVKTQKKINDLWKIHKNGHTEEF